MAKATTPEEKQAMIDMFNTLPADMDSKYEFVAKHFKKSTTTCFRIVKKSQKQEPAIKYFNHKVFPF